MYIKTIICLFVLALHSCSDNKHYTPISNSGVILAFGDSLTSGFGTTKDYSYPSILSKLSDKEVLNYGVAGETTTGGLKRLEKVLQEVSAKNVELLLLLEGGNDIMRSVDKQTIFNNLSQMITLAKQHNIQVVLISVPRRGVVLKDAKLYAELSRQHNILLLENMITDLLSTPKYKSDLVHFNKQGYHQMAIEIFNFLQEQGML